MKFMKLMKDGGPESRVHGFFFVEIKSLFSVVLLRFADGSRDAYHSHAFNALSWVFRGHLTEYTVNSNGEVVEIKPSIWPVWTPRSRFHKVISRGNTWALSFRGPWSKRWREYHPADDSFITLTHGRKVVGE